MISTGLVEREQKTFMSTIEEEKTGHFINTSGTENAPKTLYC